MKRKFILLLIICLRYTSIYSQDEPLFFEKEINAGDYRFFLTANSSGFFTGSIQVIDKYNNSVFYADSCFTGYNSDTLIDLNNDGYKELILDLGTGATMYDYNMFLVFDLRKSPVEPLVVHNAELSVLDPAPKIVSSVRMSPAVMGAGYLYSLRYEDGKLILENDVNESKVLKSLQPSEKDDLFFIDEYDKSFDPCEEGSQVLIYFEASLIQWKITGQEKKGWKFFNKHYKCSNKKNVQESLKKSIDEIYSYLKDPNNYRFSSDKY